MATMVQTLLIFLGFLLYNAAANPARHPQREVTPRLPSNSALQLELGSSLSKKAALYFPGQPEFMNDTTRWADNVTPNFVVSVEVGTEDDVATIVRPQYIL